MLKKRNTYIILSYIIIILQKDYEIIIHILLLEIFNFTFEYNNFILYIISSEIPCSNLLNILL